MGAATIVYATLSISKNVRPPTVSYPRSPWNKYFTSFSLDHQKKYGESIKELKEEAKSMLMSDENTKSRKLVLIDTLERLGVAYHFDQEIEEQLGHIFECHCEFTTDHKDDDLFITSLQFRQLRQHRHHVSCCVFDKFIGKNNKFKEDLSDDAKGLLSLYEAAHLRTHGEPILDEAVAFTKHHLKRMLQQQQLESPSPVLEDQVKRALEILPLHRGIPRIEARNYISLYEKDDSHDDVLLKLAKLDFNYVQNVYKKELCELSRWWNELELESKLSYARDRVVESYLWGTSFHFEPQYSYVRIAVAKLIQLVTTLDDTYDNYATLGEANLFTEIMERWSIDEIDQLPDFMKIVYKLFLSEYDDYEREAAEQGKLFALPYAKEAVKQVFRAYNNEKKWITRQEMPSFQEYAENSVGTSCISATCCRTIPGLKSVTKDTVDWLQNGPKIFEASAMVLRYLDDVGGYQRESQQGLTGLDFYANQHGISIQEATSRFIELSEDVWKDLNTEWVVRRNSQVPKEMIEQVLGYARVCEVFYQSREDGFTNPHVVAPHVAALFVHPIQ